MARSHGRKGGAGWGEGSPPHSVHLSTRLLECPQNPAAGCPQMEGIQDSKAKSGQVSYGPASEVLHHHLHHSWGVTWSRPEAGLNTSWPGSQGWGATLAASLHSPSSDPQWLMSPLPWDIINPPGGESNFPHTSPFVLLRLPTTLRRPSPQRQGRSALLKSTNSRSFIFWFFFSIIEGSLTKLYNI